jgi:threonine dehydratase
MSEARHLTPDSLLLQQAKERIAPYIHHTPVLTNQSINKLAGANLYFKCENLQKVGAFKMRGAANAVFSLPEAKRAKGVATHSSGNHAQALALAARQAGIQAYIVMPENAPKVKVAAVKGYGAEVIFCEPTLQAREDTLDAVVERSGATFIHPYNNYEVIAGQATAAMEFFEQVPEPLDILCAPVGGGGLLSGSALATHFFSSQTRILAAEPAGANDAWQSLQAGKLIPQTAPDTVADGLRTSLGDKTFAIIHEHVKEIICVSDEEIVAAMRLIWERMKIIAEPSGAVPLAAILKTKERWQGEKIGLIITGGNIDLEQLPF